MLKVARWLLILPATVASWYATFVLGYLLYMGLDALCPSSEMVSGLCLAPWHRIAFEALVCFCAGFAASLILISSALLAPSHKRGMSIATFAMGSIVAVIMGISSHAYGAMAGAVIVGALTLALILQRLASLALPEEVPVTSSAAVR